MQVSKKARKEESMDGRKYGWKKARRSGRKENSKIK